MVLGTIVHSLEVLLALLLVTLGLRVLRAYRAVPCAYDTPSSEVDSFDDDIIELSSEYSERAFESDFELVDFTHNPCHSLDEADLDALAMQLNADSQFSSDSQGHPAGVAEPGAAPITQGTSAILTDYIDEFFKLEQSLDLSAYRAAEVKPASVDELDIAISQAMTSEQLAQFKQTRFQQAPLQDDLIADAMLAEELPADDDIIIEEPVIEAPAIEASVTAEPINSAIMEPLSDEDQAAAPVLLDQVLLDQVLLDHVLVNQAEVNQAEVDQVFVDNVSASSSLESVQLEDEVIVVEEALSSELKSTDIMSDKVVHAMLKEARLAYH